MKKQETILVTEKLLSFINSQKQGTRIDTLIDYLDYMNKVKYSQEEMIPLLDRLCRNQKIVKSGKQYFRVGDMPK